MNGISEEFHPRTLPEVLPGDEVVISGIAGRFPESDNLHHLYDNLISKTDLITDDDRRWKLDHPDIPQRTGKINKVEKFDALFFGVHFKQAHTMDPMCRMLLEHAYEAVIDAGVNPRQIRGSRTGVFIGACFSESEKTWFYEKLQVNGFGITGCARAMLSNRISYWLGVTGPSYTIDTACSSSLYALEHAYRAIQEGLCDAAIVGGGNLCLHPYVSMQFFKLGVLSKDGRCKSFDESADGYVRSEAICVIFLQKAKDAKRIYSTVVHGKMNCDGFKEQGVTFPSSYMQSVLLNEFYMECGLPPTVVNYIEAHGTGTRVGDPEEVNAIDKVFSPGRKKPLKIGSGKSNFGHSEPASGLCSIAKVILSMERGVIPPNLHYKKPRHGVKALEDGRITVVTEPTPWDGEYAGINSFGFGGANAHVLLKYNPKTKINNGAANDTLPRLVAISGRTEDAVNTIINDLNSKTVDVEYVGLLHNIHSEDINGHLYRGYTLLPQQGIASTPLKEIKSYPGVKRPVWFVFTGMGSQWPGMGEALLRLPVFAEAIKKCDAVLKPRGIDIYHVITNKNKDAFDNILNAFVGIAAVQIGLVDVLYSIGIEPDNIIGHSVGELGCAYADGCFTAEQMVLSAYSRGLASLEAEIIYGSMAAVGLGYKELKKLCPPDIEIACHNSADSATVSGPAESMKRFVAQLQEKKIFAKEVACSNIPYHSRYIVPAGSKLLEYLEKVIPDPKPRSSKWLSSSVPIDKWDTPAAQLSSAEYHTNNLLNAVLFEETSALIPKDAITIEIAPHGLLQAILRRSLHPSVTNIALTQRGHKDNVEVFLQGLGKMFIEGLQPQLANLYPTIEFPVSRSTPMISPLIKWEHSDDWYVTSYKSQQKIVSGERIVKIALSDTDYEHMAGHIIDGRNLFPATGYLTLVWETVGMMRGELYTEVSVVFEDIKFLRATNIPKDGTIEITVTIQKGTGRFEVVEGGAAVVTGSVRACSKPSLEKVNAPIVSNDEEEEFMTSRDVYKELRLRGYQYTGLYRSIKRSNITGLKGHIVWHNDWSAFMDNMLQMQILGIDTRGLFVPTGIKKLVIDTKAHLSQIKVGEENKEFSVHVNRLYDVIVSGGIEIRGLKANAIPRRKPAGEPVLEEYKFVPHLDRAKVTLTEIASLITHISLENHLGIKAKSIELIDTENEVSYENLLSPHIAVTLGNIPLIQADVNIISTKTEINKALPPSISAVDQKKITEDTNALLAVGNRLLSQSEGNNLNLLLLGLKKNGFLLTRERLSDSNNVATVAQDKQLDIILEKTYNDELLILLKKRENVRKTTSVVYVDNNSFNWVDDMRSKMSKELEKDSNPSTRILLVGQGDFENGLMGLINCLRKEPGGEIVQGLLIQDSKAPTFSLDNPIYAEQLEKDLVISVLRENGVWGSYRHLLLPALQPQRVRHAWLNQLVRGDLSSLTWLEGPLQYGLNDNDLIRIAYSSINFKDIMLATGKLAAESVVGLSRQEQECVIGFEYAGVDMKGNRIMGMIQNRGMANLCMIDRDLSWEVPNAWSLEDAATVPCVYGTCYYALYLRGMMKKGDKVLIHAGSGGVGQAAINLALYEGCEVFTTVGTSEKRRFILDHFPEIPEDHIGNSRDTSFEQMIIKQTNGRGVDIVLNSLAEEKLRASVNCLAAGGRFLEIGKFDLAANNALGMEIFLREISFQGVMLDRLITASSAEKLELKDLISRGLLNGAIKPLVRTVFPKNQIEEAFRYMAAGKHIGKVIIKVREEREPRDILFFAKPRYHCRKDKSYIILGGLGGFGLELADWLVLRGAKFLILTSRTGISSGYQRMRLNIWQSYGVRVIVVAGKDASKLEDCESIIKIATKLAPVDGVFNLAVVLKDALWDSQTAKYFEESFQSKAWATKHLDLLTRTLCPLLRHFVVFSSVSCGRGNAGQSNYGMSNSVMERICERRAAEGLPALAVQWGAVGDVGLVAEMQEDNKELIIGGTLQQRISSCLQELDGFLQQRKPVVSSIVVAEKRTGGPGSMTIVETVLSIMGLKDLKGVSPNTSLAELGMDSMMSVEIKQTLEREFGIFLTAQDIRGLNFAKLQDMSEDKNNESKEKTVTKEATEVNVQTGMRLLVRVIRNKDINTQSCLTLPSKETLDNNEIFLVPGIEGLGSIFLNLATKLKASVTCLQLGINENAQKSIFDMADQLLPHLLERTKTQGQFVIAGYSYGALVAIELVRKLENENLNGRLILIDGAPEPLEIFMTQQISSETDEEFQNNVLLGIMNTVSPTNSLQLAVELEKNKNCSWNEKMEQLISCLPDKDFDMTPKDTKDFCTAIYNRMIALQCYDISGLPKIRSPITLVKPSIPSLRSSHEDYNLPKVTSGQVTVHYAEGNHVTVIDTQKVADIINGDEVEDATTFRAYLQEK